MRLNILVTVENVDQVRKNENNKDIFVIKLSPTGESPITHWFCTIPGDEQIIQNFLDKQNLTIMEIGQPKEFLNKWGLKVIR